MASGGVVKKQGMFNVQSGPTARVSWPIPPHAASAAAAAGPAATTTADRLLRLRSASPRFNKSRHGSGARFPTTEPGSRASASASGSMPGSGRERDRDADRRDARSPSPVRSTPVGPQEEMDWAQVLADERNRVDTMDRALN